MRFTLNGQATLHGIFTAPNGALTGNGSGVPEGPHL
jgi:hypothetical protein